MADVADIAGIFGGTRRGIANLPWKEYKSLVALNPSTIVHGLTSMRHLKYAWDHGREDTDSLRWGRAVHCLLFEPTKFAQRYRSWEGRRAGGAYADFAIDAWRDGAEVLPATGKLSIEAAIEAAQSFIGEPLVQSMIASGVSEQTVFEVEGAIQCRGRTDWLDAVHRDIVDLKTGKNIVARAFGRDFYGYNYDVKLGLYRRWVSKVTGLSWGVQVIAIENSPPYDVVTFPVPDAVLDRGERMGLEVIAQVEQCIRAGSWPGIAKGQPYYLHTPTWEMDEEMVEFDE